MNLKLRKVSIALILLAALSMLSSAEETAYRITNIENFKTNTSLVFNLLHGQHGPVVQTPARAELSIQNGAALISYSRDPGYLAGFYTKLPATKAGLFNAEDYDELQIRAVIPEGQNIFINLASSEAQPKSNTEEFLPLNIYQVSADLYIIPLSAIPNTNLQSLTSIRFYGNATSGVFKLIEINFVDYLPPSKQLSPDFMIDDFNNNLNSLGNRDNILFQAPSLIEVSRIADLTNNRFLKLEINNLENSWSMYLNPLNQGNKYFDAVNYQTLLFKVRGEKGAEDAQIAVADHVPNSLEKPWKAGNISSYLKHPLTTNWEEVVIPLTDFGPVTLNKLKYFLLIFNTNGQSTIYLDNLRFSTKAIATPKKTSELGFMIQNFDNSLINNLGNEVQTFEEKPSTIKISTSLQGNNNDLTPALEINYARSGQGQCGLMFPLTSKNKYFSAQDYKTLNFQIRGDENAVVEVYILDKNTSTATNLNQASSFKKITIKNIVPQWQNISIELKDLAIDSANLERIVFSFPEIQQGTIYLDNLSFNN